MKNTVRVSVRGVRPGEHVTVEGDFSLLQPAKDIWIVVDALDVPGRVTFDEEGQAEYREANLRDLIWSSANNVKWGDVDGRAEWFDKPPNGESFVVVHLNRDRYDFRRENLALMPRDGATVFDDSVGWTFEVEASSSDCAEGFHPGIQGRTSSIVRYGQVKQHRSARGIVCNTRLEADIMSKSGH